MKDLILMIQEINSKKEELDSLEKQLILKQKELMQNYSIKYNGKVCKDWDFYSGSSKVYIYELSIDVDFSEIELVEENCDQENNVFYLSDYQHLRVA